MADETDICDGTWTFYDAWAAFPDNRVREGQGNGRLIGEFTVSLRGPWRALAAASGLVEALAALDGKVQDQDAVRRVLLDLGYRDRTAELRGDGPAYCPACRGKGVLDDIAPSDRRSGPEKGT